MLRWVATQMQKEREKIDFGLTKKLDAYWLQRFHTVYKASGGNTIYYFSMLEILKFCLQAGFI